MLKTKLNIKQPHTVVLESLGIKKELIKYDLARNESVEHIYRNPYFTPTKAEMQRRMGDVSLQWIPEDIFDLLKIKEHSSDLLLMSGEKWNKKIHVYNFVNQAIRITFFISTIIFATVLVSVDWGNSVVMLSVMLSYMVLACLKVILANKYCGLINEYSEIEDYARKTDIHEAMVDTNKNFVKLIEEFDEKGLPDISNRENAKLFFHVLDLSGIKEFYEYQTLVFGSIFFTLAFLLTFTVASDSPDSFMNGIYEIKFSIICCFSILLSMLAYMLIIERKKVNFNMIRNNRKYLSKLQD